MDKIKKGEEIYLPDLPEAAANNTEGCPAFKNMFSHCKNIEIQRINRCKRQRKEERREEEEQEEEKMKMKK